jgi:hypothetical protein
MLTEMASESGRFDDIETLVPFWQVLEVAKGIPLISSLNTRPKLSAPTNTCCDMYRHWGGTRTLPRTRGSHGGTRLGTSSKIRKACDARQMTGLKVIFTKSRKYQGQGRYYEFRPGSSPNLVTPLPLLICTFLSCPPLTIPTD